MSVKILMHSEYEAWNNFVFQNPESTFFHRAEWKDIIENCFNFECPYLYTEQENKITGILPLSHVRRPFFGNALTSLPLCVYGGAIGNVNALTAEALKKANDLKVGYVELRNKKLLPGEWRTYTNFSTFIKKIPGNEDENLLSIPRKQRAEIRKAIKTGLEIKIENHIDNFYPLYAISVRNLGTPVFPRHYAQKLLDIFGDDCNIMTVFLNNVPLCSVLNFYFKDQVLPYYAGSTPEARHYSAYPFMYYALMNYASTRNIKIFDFGRSSNNSGAYKFKKNFGFEPTNLHYQYQLITEKYLPNMSADNARNKMVTRIWRNLPLSLTNRLGPILYPAIV